MVTTAHFPDSQVSASILYHLSIPDLKNFDG